MISLLPKLTTLSAHKSIPSDQTSSVKPKTLKLLREKVGHTFQDIGSGKDLLNRTLFLRKQSNNQQLMNYKASACEGNL